MKKITSKSRYRDVLRSHSLRLGSAAYQRKRTHRPTKSPATTQWADIIRRIQKDSQAGLLTVEFSRKRRAVTIFLPEVLNFSTHYDQTTVNFNTIRLLVTSPQTASNSLRLRTVNFDRVSSLSTSASIVLAAELSRWDDYIAHRLRPKLETWNPNIVRQLRQFGFFKLFSGDQSADQEALLGDGDIVYVPYIKGLCGEKEHRRHLKESLEKAIGDEIDQWVILSGGLSEAITNVTHHAYPNDAALMDRDKSWFMGGSFDKITNTLRIVFYDQGVGIPRSLPSSTVWEHILKYCEDLKIPFSGRKKDATLLKAAVEYKRTRTGADDRGKGLQDLLDFIRERRDGYLSILSQKGLYRYSNVDGVESDKTETFEYPILGTLIIWKVRLNA